MQVARRSLFASLIPLVVSLTLACGVLTPASSGGGTAAPAVSTTPAPSAFPRTVADFQGRGVTLARAPERIVSIGPSNTEFLFALGAGDRVVGVDDFSDEPAQARAKEKVGGVKVSLEKVTALRPDLVVTTKFTDGTVERLAGIAPAVIVVDPQGVPDVARTAVLLGQALGADGGALAARIDATVAEVRKKTASAPRPRVLHEVDASDPTRLFTVGPGSFIADLIDIAGGTNVAANTVSQYPQLSLEEIVRTDPQVIVLGDSDYGVTPEQVAARPGWSTLSAVRDRKVFPIAGSLVSRPGPRLGDAAEAYARLLHPELYR
ncbi:MAG: helical backbone metal receptor [Chloroflexota bacterium]|nr:helical backbone metal receptor [Chloroflexota bacterium]